MALNVVSERAQCYKCGISYSSNKGNFPVCYSQLHKGVGFLHICRDCIDNMYVTYLSQCNDTRKAMRLMCRKLDIFWSEDVFQFASKKAPTRTLISSYLTRINTTAYAGKSYDDTLLTEGMLWNFIPYESNDVQQTVVDNVPDDEEPIADSIISYWGYGYSPEGYRERENRLSYYKENFQQGDGWDLGTEVLIRQICNLEVDITRDGAAGKTVEKSVSTLNTLLGSLNLKPAQKKEDNNSSIDATPLGVWAKRWEDYRRIPEPDPELQDVDGIIKYILVWFYGHLAKMVNVKNAHSRLYDEEITKLRVNAPEYIDDSDDDDTVLYNIFSDKDE